MANHSVPAGDATGGHGSLLTAALPSAQRRQGCERVLGLVFDRGRLEDGVRLARIKVDSENQESVAMAPRSIVSPRRGSGASRSQPTALRCRAQPPRLPRRGTKVRSTGSSISVLDRIERRHAKLPDGRRDTAHHMQSTGIEPGHIECRLQPRQGAKIGGLGDGVAGSLVGGKRETASAQRHVMNADRNAPRSLRGTFRPYGAFIHGSRHSAASMGWAASMACGSGKVIVARLKASPSWSASRSTTART